MLDLLTELGVSERKIRKSLNDEKMRICKNFFPDSGIRIIHLFK